MKKYKNYKLILNEANSARDYEYKVTIADTDEDRKKGLQKVSKLAFDEGMLFMYDEPQKVSFWMKDVKIPLDIIFIDEDGEVISKVEGEPGDSEMHEEEDVQYVLELNKGSHIDEEFYIRTLLPIKEVKKHAEGGKMEVLDEKGKTQMELDGGERIFSIESTKKFIKLAKRCKETKNESDYLKLGKAVYDEIKAQNARPQDYVENE